jgi:hypothetical protein
VPGFQGKRIEEAVTASFIGHGDGLSVRSTSRGTGCGTDAKPGRHRVRLGAIRPEVADDNVGPHGSGTRVRGGGAGRLWAAGCWAALLKKDAG